jgi:hypothetical protein
MRVFADCRLTADTFPTESHATPHGMAISIQNPVGSFRLILPTRRLTISQRFQRIPSVGSRQTPPYSYGVTLAPPDMAAVSAVPTSSTEKGQPHE